MTSQKPRYRNVAEFTAAKRAAATEAGRPIERMAHPLVFNVMATPGTPYLVVASRDKTLHVAEFVGSTEVKRAHGGEAVTVLSERVTGLHWGGDRDDPPADQPRAIVFADHSTINLSARLLADVALVKQSSNKHYAASRRLSFRASQPTGHRFVILTDALKDRFHAPADVNVHSIEGWAAAFGTQANAAGLAMMMRRVSEGQYVEGEILRKFDNLERNSLSTAAYSSIKWACSTLETAAKVIDLSDTLKAMDPLLADVNSLSGLTTTVEYAGYNSKARFNIIGNCNFKEGDSLWLRSSGGSLYSFTVNRLFLDRDRLKVEMTSTSTQFKSVRKWANGDMHAGERLVALTSPFLFNSKSSATRDWTPYEKHERVEGRQMPVSVAIAGARTA